MHRGFLFLVFLIFLLGTLAYGQVHPETERISKLLRHLPQTVELEIEYRPIRGLVNPQSEWYIGESAFWVRLYPKETYDIEKLDKTKRYNVTGIILEEQYGVVNVWVKSLAEKTTSP